MKALWTAVFLAALAWSAAAPYDYFTWFLEVFPALAAFVILAFTAKNHPLTPLVYFFILVHCVILMVGGHYTYARVPFFDTLGELIGAGRNNYDKLGHLAQGFVPALIAREVLIRCRAVKSKAWLALFVLSLCLAISALYELVEWGVAVAVQESAESFLGTQGYVWDTQSDMAHALAGAGLALVLLSRLHDRQLAKLDKERAAEIHHG